MQGNRIVRKRKYEQAQGIVAKELNSVPYLSKRTETYRVFTKTQTGCKSGLLSSQFWSHNYWVKLNSIAYLEEENNYLKVKRKMVSKRKMMRRLSMERKEEDNLQRVLNCYEQPSQQPQPEHAPDSSWRGASIKDFRVTLSRILEVSKTGKGCNTISTRL